MRKLRWMMVVLLLAGAAGLGYKLRADWHSFRTANAPEAIKLRPVPPLTAQEAPPTRDYGVVAQQNPFHPERNDAVPPPVVVAVASGPPPLIYGSMILGTERFALMGTESDPKPHKVNEGESFGGYKLAEVRPQSVVLETGGSSSEVMLYNALSRLRRDSVKTQASSAGAPHVTTASSSGTAGGSTTVAAPEPAANAAAASQPAARPGKRIMETPFGPIEVDAK